MYVVHYSGYGFDSKILYCIYFDSDSRARRFYDFLLKRGDPCDLLDYSPLSDDDYRVLTENRIRMLLKLYSGFSSRS